MDIPTEVTRWDGRTYGISIALSKCFCYMARGDTTEHALLRKNMCLEIYFPYYLLEFTIFAVDHDPNASLSCTYMETAELQAQL